MEVKKGSSRIAFCGEKLTAKVPYFPLSNLGIIPTDLKNYWQMYDGWDGIVEYFTNPEELTCFQERFLRGWLENVREALWSKRLGDLVVPTYFSFAGFLNLQSTAGEAD